MELPCPKRNFLMKLFSNKYYFGAFLLFMSAAVYVVHFAIFRNAHDLFFYLIFDVAFVFVQVLMVSLIIEQVITRHEKKALLNKMNMVIGTFFSEVGTHLVALLSPFDGGRADIDKNLLVTADWSGGRFDEAARKVAQHKTSIDCTKCDIATIKEFLTGRRSFLLELLGNQNLLEHESFSELLWAVFHLTEELCFRKNTTTLGHKDAEHLSGDMNRVHAALLREWIAYMKHLKTAYPYLFSLAVRTNPFNPEAKVEID
jgi:hypothetical protein